MCGFQTGFYRGSPGARERLLRLPPTPGCQLEMQIPELRADGLHRNLKECGGRSHDA